MKVAVMQPYFFPYIGYFSLIHSVEHFMFFDDVQYIRKSWMSRNRLLNIEKSEPFFIRPNLVKPDYKALLTTVKLETNEGWKSTLLEQLKGYKNKAPFYHETVLLIEKLLEEKFEYLNQFNIYSITKICEAVGIERKIDKYTDYNFWFEEKPQEGDWGRVIASELKASHYVNSPGGESFIFPEPFTDVNIKLGFIQPNLVPYSQGDAKFTPYLSIIDVLMFNGIHGALPLIKDFNIKWTN